MSFEEKVATHVPHFRAFAEKICNLTTEILDASNADDDDHLGVMGICFLSKQYDHLEGVLLLQEHKHRDAELIARSMLEGLALFLWASQKPNERPQQWREFGHVHNFRLLRQEQQLLKDLDPAHVARIEERVKALGDQFYSPRTFRALEKGEPLPDDPFTQDWTAGLSVKEVFGKIESDRQLHKYYLRFSDWHHWSFAGLARALDTKGASIKYKSDSELSSIQALAVGFQCLYQTCELVSQHFGLNFESRLEQLKNDYLKTAPPI
jgi:hypothetical protein